MLLSEFVYYYVLLFKLKRIFVLILHLLNYLKNPSYSLIPSFCRVNKLLGMKYYFNRLWGLLSKKLLAMIISTILTNLNYKRKYLYYLTLFIYPNTILYFI